MFGGEASDKKVKVLSGGERTRLAMIKLLLEPVNFLILDEPTNHLDMKGRQTVAAYLKKKKGFILVSHDRNFLGRAASLFRRTDVRHLAPSVPFPARFSV